MKAGRGEALMRIVTRLTQTVWVIAVVHMVFGHGGDHADHLIFAGSGVLAFILTAAHLMSQNNRINKIQQGGRK